MSPDNSNKVHLIINMDEEFQISYSDKYHDDYYDYIIVYLTENTYHKIPPERRGKNYL